MKTKTRKNKAKTRKKQSKNRKQKYFFDKTFSVAEGRKAGRQFIQFI